MKKLISCALSTILLVSSVVSAFAQAPVNYVRMEQYESKKDNVTLYTLVDDDKIRKTQTSDENKTYTVTFDKVNRNITIEEQDLKKNSAPKVITGNLDELKKTMEAKEKSNKSLSTGETTTEAANLLTSSINQNTFSNYEYTKWISTTNKWELRRPEANSFNSWIYFQTYETALNKTYLANFKANVDKVNGLEVDCVLSGSASLLADFLVIVVTVGEVATAGLITPAEVTAIAGALTANTVFITNCVKLSTAWNDCYNDYFEVYYNSTIL